MLVVRHMSGAGATGAGPKKLAALFWEPRTVTTVGQTNHDSGKLHEDNQWTASRNTLQ